MDTCYRAGPSSFLQYTSLLAPTSTPLAIVTNPEAFRKSELWHGNPEGEPASVFTTIDFKEHARIRRFMDPAFSERAILQQEPILQEYVSLCINKLRERSSLTGKPTVN